MRERALRRLQASDVGTYLEGRRWSIVDDSDTEEGFRVYRAPIVDDFGDSIELAVPFGGSVETSYEEIIRLITSIASLEGRDFRAVEADVAGVSIDTLNETARIAR